ncbi:MAG TPA: S9 family peptidase [Steroidobacteraceae bacterium]
MSLQGSLRLILALSLPTFLAHAEAPFDAAAAFGARPSVESLSLSPDGKSVAYVVPTGGQGSALNVLSLAKGASPHIIATVSGKPDRLGECHWVSNDRLVCVIYGVVSASVDVVPYWRVVAVNADGTDMKMLSAKSNSHSRGIAVNGGTIIDWLPDEDGAALMSRWHLPDDHLDSHFGSSKKGLGVDWINTRTLSTRSVESPRDEVVEYISDGRGAVRIMGVESTRGVAEGYASGNINYFYRREGSQEWQKFGELVGAEHNGFEPNAVDHDRNLAYGFKKKDGRRALYSIALDGSLREDVVFARPDVDVEGLLRIGRRNRVVGVTYVTEFPQSAMFDPELEKLVNSLSKALPMQPLLHITDSNADESKLLIRAGSDQDPGVFYIFDRSSRQLDTFFVVRNELEGVKLARVKPVSYPAKDGTMIPGYLTLPPSVDTAKDLPAIVLPHGGPSYRDVWGFDWLAQFFASRGYAVLQPNFRGSAGYGDDWFQKNGFRSWPTAIGDVLDAGRWLVAQGIANPNKLAIVGWSYGGYAALQSAVVDTSIFKAIVAIAPVTDLQELKEEHRNWADFPVISLQIGNGPHVREGSPALNAAKIKVPVLLFHGAMDGNVLIRQSKEMADRLAAAGVPHELVTWPDLDHQLDDSAARADMLRKSDAFLRRAMGLQL